MEEFKPQIPKEMLQHASFESTKEAQMSLRTHWGIWLSAGVILAIIVSLCVALIPQPGRVHPYSGCPGSSESDPDSNPSVLSFNPSEPSISGFSPESSQVHFSKSSNQPPSSPNTTSSTDTVGPPSSTVTLRDMEGVYTSTSNGITIRLKIFNADNDTADGLMYSTNAGSRSCAVYMIGGTIGVVFPDLSELRLRRTGKTALTFVDSGVVLYRR